MTDFHDSRTCGRHYVIDSVEMHFFATLAQADFYKLRVDAEDLRMWPSYEDFVLERDGSFLGLSWAGLEVVQVEVPLGAFERWVKRTGAVAGLRTLDDFAMRRWLKATFPEWTARLVQSVAESPSTGGGHLDIPLHPAGLGEGPDPFARRQAISESELAAEIARECLGSSA